ncbi:MAG: hypothetical protein NG712_01255, partial [Omnitrophica bacterium]|nr:hypothetical protein [Candidatus Omnitrophota bacterium]
MEKGKIFLIVLVSIATFLLVYTPHYGYPFPRHIDEWHHITETIKLQRGEYFAEELKFLDEEHSHEERKHRIG